MVNTSCLLKGCIHPDTTPSIFVPSSSIGVVNNNLQQQVNKNGDKTCFMTVLHTSLYNWKCLQLYSKEWNRIEWISLIQHHQTGLVNYTSPWQSHKSVEVSFLHCCHYSLLLFETWLLPWLQIFSKIQHAWNQHDTVKWYKFIFYQWWSNISISFQLSNGD